MLLCVALVRTDVSEELIAYFIRVTRILVFLCSVRQLLVTASVVPSLPILVTLMKEARSSSETSVLTRATWRNIPEDTILHSHRRENLKSYLIKICFIPIYQTDWCRILDNQKLQGLFFFCITTCTMYEVLSSQIFKQGHYDDIYFVWKSFSHFNKKYILFLCIRQVAVAQSV
jgi:hypothetical protein